MLTGGNRITCRKPYPRVTLPTKNPLWTDLDTNPSLHGQKPVTNGSQPIKEDWTSFCFGEASKQGLTKH